METNPSKSSVLIYVLVLALVLSPILPCQPASVHLGGGGRKLMISNHFSCVHTVSVAHRLHLASAAHVAVPVVPNDCDFAIRGG
ncbi:hypothetical protein Bca4012_073325 [Brassica carinata]